MATYQYTFEALDRMSGPVKKIGGSLAAANVRLQAFSARIEGGMGRVAAFGDKLMSLRNIVAGSLAVGIAQNLGSAVIDTVAKFETMGAVLENTLGSKGAAQRVMSDLNNFAEKTPFEIDQLTDSWVRLANQGFRPNMDQMTMLGDLASSTGKDISMLSEAVIDAQVGEFERLKEFGIRAEKNGDRVKFTFRGMSQEVDFTADSIQQYLLSLGQMEGVQGAMDKIMATAAGGLSNYRDAVTRLKLTIGLELLPQLTGMIEAGQRTVKWLIDAVKWVSLNREQVGSWVKVLGIAAGAILGIVVAVRTFSAVSAMLTAIRASWVALTGAINLGKIAMIAFNLISSLNPFGILIIAIAGVITYLGVFTDKLDGVKNWLAQLGAWLWENHPFAWMIDLVERVFPGFKGRLNDLMNSVIGVFKQAWDWLYKNFFKPALDALDAVFGKFFDFKKLPALQTAPMALAAGEDPYAPIGGGATPGPGPMKPGGSSNVGLSKGMNGVTGGERNVKNITINIAKLNDGGININTTSLGMASGQIKSEMERILLSVVNDVNYQ